MNSQGRTTCLKLVLGPHASRKNLAKLRRRDTLEMSDVEALLYVSSFMKWYTFGFLSCVQFCFSIVDSGIERGIARVRQHASR